MASRHVGGGDGGAEHERIVSLAAFDDGRLLADDEQIVAVAADHLLEVADGVEADLEAARRISGEIDLEPSW